MSGYTESPRRLRRGLFAFMPTAESDRDANVVEACHGSPGVCGVGAADTCTVATQCGRAEGPRNEAGRDIIPVGRSTDRSNIETSHRRVIAARCSAATAGAQASFRVISECCLGPGLRRDDVRNCRCVSTFTRRYQFSVPVKSAEPAAQFEASEQGRRMVYEIIGNECRLLQATLASSCSAERANVQSSVQQRGGSDGLAINGSASFKIILKPRS
jgi:hypothetical protein